MKRFWPVILKSSNAFLTWTVRLLIAGALPAETKELLGLVASAVLRCDDCVRYHLGRCYELQLSEATILEALEIATLVGGTIVIPHLRRAVDYWEQLQNQTTT